MKDRILIATHGNPTSDSAVRVAAEIAKREEAHVSVLAVLEPLPVLDAGFSPAVVPYDAFDRRRGEELLARVTAQVRAVSGEHCDWPITLAVGRPASEIVKASRADDISLVVMGIGRHAAADRLFGSETALKVSRQSPVPVLAVAPGNSELPHRALVATDFSASSFEAARAALHVLGTPARLTLAHARPEPEIPPIAYEEWLAAYGAGVAESLGRVRVRLSAPVTVAVDAVTLSGDPARAILDYAAAHRVDVIACGSHGFNFVERLLVGSVATTLLRTAPCSVLLVPATIESEQKPAKHRERANAVSFV